MVRWGPVARARAQQDATRRPTATRARGGVASTSTRCKRAVRSCRGVPCLPAAREPWWCATPPRAWHVSMGLGVRRAREYGTAACAEQQHGGAQRATAAAEPKTSSSRRRGSGARLLRSVHPPAQVLRRSHAATVLTWNFRVPRL